MGFGDTFGGGGRGADEYFVVPKERTRGRGGNPGGWKVKKGPTDAGANTVSTHNKKSAAKKRGKELARKADTVLTVFDAAKKSSSTFDFRS